MRFPLLRLNQNATGAPIANFISIAGYHIDSPSCGEKWGRQLTLLADAGRKARGAYYTPPEIAAFLSRWAIGGRSANVLDPTCGDGALLQAAGQELRAIGVSEPDLTGIEIDDVALRLAKRRLESEDLGAALHCSSLFDFTPGHPSANGSKADAVIGNPPFIRYHGHNGLTREAANRAALAQGVQLSGLASAWAACLIHSSSFLKPGGRLAMVLPAELLTVNYAGPVRDWLRLRFGRIAIVTFRRLQFDALANVVLLLADGEGGTSTVHVARVSDASDLNHMDPFSIERDLAPCGDKWSTLLLPDCQSSAFRRCAKKFARLEEEYGRVKLGAVTGANEFFVVDTETRSRFNLTECQLLRTSPPGSKHFNRLAFTLADWEHLRDEGQAVWQFQPGPDDDSAPVEAYKRFGEGLGVSSRYKCRIRPQWWRPPGSDPPDFFFTYMSNRFPRLVANDARVSYLNSVHGIYLFDGVPEFVRRALPLAMLNSLTILGAELGGRSYGGGILKLEPREAAILPAPKLPALSEFWGAISCEWGFLNEELVSGNWRAVVERVDQVLLESTLGMNATSLQSLRSAHNAMRRGRLNLARGRRL